MNYGLMLRLGMLGVFALAFLVIVLVGAMREMRRADGKELARSIGTVSRGPFRGPSVAFVEWMQQSSNESSNGTATSELQRAA